MQLNGDLAKVSLTNLLQLVRNGELTGKITLLQGAKTATIFVEDGNVAHVDADGFTGREALFELFLWISGSFLFVEGELGAIPRSLSIQNPEDSFERLMREGINYLDQKKYLEQLRITGDTILSGTERIKELVAAAAGNPRVGAALAMVQPVIDRLDGQKTLSIALADLPYSRRAYVQAVSILLAEGLAVVVEKPMPQEGETIDLPPWVLARLQQDNANLSQAIVDMVIWVDRVKCWMYQADSDFAKMLEHLNVASSTIGHDEDFFADIDNSLNEFQGTLFGESAPSLSSSTQAPEKLKTSNDNSNQPRQPSVNSADHNQIAAISEEQATMYAAVEDSSLKKR